MEETKRLFVGNLPDGITDSEVRRQFGNYGRISSLEIKTKKGIDGKVNSTFAFIDLIVSGSKLSQCLNSTNGSDMGGNRIRVQIAKESFMDKLKAEREQSSNRNASTKSDQALRNNSSSRVDFHPKNNSSIKFDTSSKNSNVTKLDDKVLYDPLQMIRSQKTSLTANIPSSNFTGNEKSFSKTNQKENSFKKVEKPVKKTVASESSSDDCSESDEDSVTTTKKSTNQKKKSSLMSELENFSGMWNDLDSKPVEVERRTESTHEAERRFGTTIPEEQPPTNLRVEVSKPENVKDENTKKRELDNQKRIQSLQERSKALQAQTFQIQSALSLTDKKMNRKIIFDQDDEEAYSHVQKDNNKPKKKSNIQLFDEEPVDPEDIDDADRFRMRPHFDGTSGKELLELQSRFGNDSRFKFDSRFRETNEEMVEDQGVDEFHEEKNRQMSILSSLLPLAPTAFKKETSQQLKSKTFVRFDPKVQEHTKFEKTVQKEVVKESKKKGRRDENYNDQVAAPLPEVSSERYYTTGALNIGSGQSSGGFSLRNLFQTSEQEEEAEKPVEETPITPTEPVKQDRQVKVIDNPIKQNQATGYWKNAGMWHETLFLQPNDSRLKEALDFIFKKTDDEHYRDRNVWPNHRDRLMRFYKNKMRRSVSSQLPGQKRTLETADDSAHLYKAQPDPRKKPRKTFYKK